MREEFYFTQNLTENEHYIVASLIEEGCSKYGLTLQYYRKFKTGHVPMQRECKILGDISTIKKMLKEQDIYPENYNKK